MNINLKQLRFNENLTQEQLGNILGVTKQQVGRYENGISQIPQDKILVLQSKFPDYINETHDDCINIPIRGEVEASMGYGVAIYNESKTGVYSISRQLVNDLGVNKESAEIIFGRGNSMEPTILGGDALLIDKSKTDVSDGKIYCIRYEGQLLTKRLQKLSRSKVKIISDNKDYDAITIDFEKEIDVDFEIIGEVRWSGRIFK